MRNIFIACLLLLLGVSPVVQGQDDGLSHRMVPDLPRYCGRVVGPEGKGIWKAKVFFKYGENSKEVHSGLLGEFLVEISEIPETLEIRVEAGGFKTAEWTYAAKEKGDNYLTLRILPKDKELNELICSADNIQVKLGEKTLEYPNEQWKSLRGNFEAFFPYDLPGFSFDAPMRVKGKLIHYANVIKEGWDEEELAHERIARWGVPTKTRRATKHRPGFKWNQEDLPGCVLRVYDYLNRGGIPYARVCVIAGRDTIRLTSDAFGCCFWKTSKLISKCKFIVMAEGYETHVSEYYDETGRPRNIFLTTALWPKHFRGLTRAMIFDDKIQIIQGDTLTYPLQEGAVKPFEKDFAGNLLRSLPGVSMENGLLTINGKPIHCVGMERENFSEYSYNNMVDHLLQMEIVKDGERASEE
jgi:hypothetical protein